jgi:hypothetical protein
MLNLDTHMLVHALRGDLSPHEHELLSSNAWGVAAIVLWELATFTLPLEADREPAAAGEEIGIQPWCGE